MRYLQGIGRDSVRQTANIGVSDRHAETLWDLRYSERLSATIGDSERHTGIPLNWKRQCETCGNTMGPERR